MKLLDQVLAHVKSVGYEFEGEEHQMLNKFVNYLGTNKVISGFSDSPVIIKFISELSPQPIPEVVEEVVEPIVEKVAEPIIETPTVK